MLSSSVEARATHIVGAEALGLAMIAVLAAVLLFWGLADPYLWQDEAATAVLATRMLRFGKPLAYDGVNPLPATYCYLKPYYQDPNRSYFEPPERSKS